MKKGKHGIKTSRSDGRSSSRKRKTSTDASSSTSLSCGMCENVSDRYEKVGRVGQGTYGVVYKARDKQTGKYVALKRCIPHHESSDGFPLTTLREIHTLRLCSRHENIVDLLTVAVSQSGGGVFLVCEYCPQDLAQIMDDFYPKNRKSPFNQGQVKTLAHQLLSALEFCHSMRIVHRDIKPSNMLYKSGELKLCDFGLSRQLCIANKLTPNVVSLWYRAPELLLQQNFSSYSFGIDLWAVGCVVGELLQGYPLLDGKDEVDQVLKMTACLGMPPERLYDSSQHSKLLASPSAHRNQHHSDLWDRFSYLGTESLTILTKLLEYNPKDRFSAREALDSDYFASNPPRSKEMPRFSTHQELTR